MTPRVLTIAASDPGGGAGIEADLKVFAAHRVSGLTAITALTVQDSRSLISVHPVETDVFRRVLHALAHDLPVSAVKIGALASEEHAQEVKIFLAGLSPLPRVVLDPVIKASSGPRLLQADDIGPVLEPLLPFIELVTPNLDEAAWLTKRAVKDIEGMRDAAESLCSMGARAALIKGGHLETEPREVLCHEDGMKEWSGPRMPREFHGTGCVLSAAIASNLGLGLSLVESVDSAREYLYRCMAGAVPGKGDSMILDFPPSE